MAVVREFALPDLGEGLTEAEIVRWLVAVGDVVAVDQPVVEVETAKAMVEVPCPYGGVVTARFGEEGSELPVGAALLTVAVGDPAEPPPSSDRSGPSGRSVDGAGAPPAGRREGGPGGTAPGDRGDGSPTGTGAAGGTTVGGGSGGKPGGPEGSGNVLVGYGTGAPAARRRRLRASPMGVPGRGASPRGSAEAVGTGVAASRPDSAAGPAALGEVSAAGPGHRAGGQRPVGRVAGAVGAERVREAAPSPAAERSPAPVAPDTGVQAGAPTLGRPVPVISPLVRRLAREHRLDLAEVRGTGPDGLILRSDVERAIAAGTREREAPAHPGVGGASGQAGASGQVGAGAAVPAGAVTSAVRSAPDGVRESTAVAAATAAGWASGALAHAAGPTGVRAEERIPLRGVRGAVADKLSRSRAEIPEATCWVDADATELLAARAAMNAAGGAAAGGTKISLLAVLARICTAALARFPELNATVDTEAREIVRLPAVHLGFAAQTERGLMVPVVRDAHLRDAESLSAEFERLTDRARSGRLSPAELTGGTFTLNNYGVFGVDGSTPIINHPEAAMLGVGRIADKPWVHGGELAIRRVVQLSLTFDHRVCDGGTAGGFLRYVADCVEQPAVLLRTV